MRRGARMLLTMMGGLILAATAAAQTRTTEVVLGTATPGGGFPLYGAGLVETVHEADPALVVTPRNTKGSTENVPLLEEGKLDLALGRAEAAYAALSGIRRPPAPLKILAAVYSPPALR